MPEMGATLSDQDNPTFFTVHEFATRTRRHYQTVYQAVRAGRIPAFKEGGIWLIPATYLEARQTEAFERYSAATSVAPPERPRHDPVAAAKAAVRQHVRAGAQ